MGVGRFFCLAVPFGLTIASLVCIIIVQTAQITNKDLYFAKFNTQNLSVSAVEAASLSTRGVLPVFSLDARDDALGVAHLHTEALASTAASVASGSNLTASDLGLADYYTVGLWSYCNHTSSSDGSVTVECSARKNEFYFDPFSIWGLDDTTAESAIDSTLLNDAMASYKKGSKWTWWMYLFALIFSALEILFALVAIFSTIGACSATLFSSAASITIIAASVLATVMWSIVVASFNKELKQYGLSASVSTHMLAVTWLAVAFSVGAGFFWMVSTCCCRASSQSRSRSTGEKDIPLNGPYHQVHDPAFVSNPYAGQTTAYKPQTEFGTATGINAKPIKDPENAYEPYRHGNV